MLTSCNPQHLSSTLYQKLIKCILTTKTYIFNRIRSIFIIRSLHWLLNSIIALFNQGFAILSLSFLVLLYFRGFF